MSRSVLICAALLIVSYLWGFPTLNLFSHGLGQRLLASALRLVLIGVTSALASEIGRYLITEGLSKLSARSTDPRRAAQLHTLGPLLRGLTQAAIIILATLMALGEIGVQIGPLIAGAGVVGIAVGFGAQTLVKDFLTGVFLIAEDVVAVGDIVRVGSSGGLVEKMTLRTIQLRDFDGTLHIFPYNEAQIVHNLTKHFSYYVFDLLISYDSDIDQAIRLMRKTGSELQADPVFSIKILEPIEVVGVETLGDSGVHLKARIKTRPIEQWNVGREYNRRIKLAFDREGIRIPYPHLQVVTDEAGKCNIGNSAQEYPSRHGRTTAAS